ncbi:MAG TPA: PIG-L family deacetylase [Chthoniobacterales bacterium]|nr:PIG-L family deacetylase [Chthoniobacterales bacterium]
MPAGEIRLALEKLNVVGRVLYVAAHPDDENTGLIAYFANGALYETAYLSLTRGDGGQNLIGPELGDQLGVIRTQELLAARRIDKGRQFFTRANDFGFSKSADETQRIWDREKILADVVWTIRKFRPDIIVTRFPLEDDRTHGHHTSSAQLAQEAFRIAADPKRFPEQLKFVQPWQPTRLLWNTSQFFFRARNVPFDPTGLILLEAGGYQPLLGRSYAEIDAASRTMHKSQGFGVSIERGEQKEYFKFLEGKPIENGDLFTGIDTTWARVPKGAELTERVRAIAAGYDMQKPAASVPALLELRRLLVALGSDFWAQEKLATVDSLIAACLGLHLEAVTDKPAAQPGDTANVQLEAINRSDVPVRFKSARVLANAQPEAIDAELRFEQLFTKKTPVKLPETLPFSLPYWLRERGTLGTFTVADQTLIGRPENPPPFPVEFTLEIGGQEIVYNVEPRFRKVDRVEGETNQPLVIAPPVFVDLPRPVFVFGNNEPKTLDVRVIASAEKVTGNITLEAPAGWKVEPASAPVELHGAESETTLVFQVTPAATAGEATLRAFFAPAAGQRVEAFSRQRIEYPHIEPQTLISPAQAKLVRAGIENKAARIGYLPGAGDSVPESLTDIATEVKMLENREVKADNLARFDAVVIGVRASNAHPNRVSAWMPELLAYAKKGGVVIMQYTTTPGPKPEHLPYPLKVSRDRVTDETADVRVLAPDHPVMKFPNKITKVDFDGWVQERGLYFPNEWDGAWTPILSSNDPGEKPADGGLLVSRVEKGWFIYTGYAWFRELPAGVPGAYRLFANMLSLGKLY